MKLANRSVWFRFPWLLTWVVILGIAGNLRAELPDSLAGTWTMSDESPALMHTSNKAAFSIVRAIPGESQWADGFFFLKWAGEASPERGYYSTKTGRIWITTYRWVNQKRERVEYRGELSEHGEVLWKGTASTTGNAKTSWEFVATKG